MATGLSLINTIYECPLHRTYLTLKYFICQNKNSTAYWKDSPYHTRLLKQCIYNDRTIMNVSCPNEQLASINILVTIWHP